MDISEPAKRGGDVYHWDTVGFVKDSSLVASFVGEGEGRGTMYLARHPSFDYYRGYAYLCDCNSPNKGAVMVCPYVLYKADNPVQERSAEQDPLIVGDARCWSVNQNGALQTALPGPGSLQAAASAPSAAAKAADCVK
jgi:hypothetical protein